MSGWRLILGVVLIRLLGLRGPLLEQEDGEQHVGRHLEELAFPVLEHRRDEVAAGQIGQETDGREFMQAQFLGLGSPSRERLADKGNQEQAEQCHRESIVPQEPSHTPDLTLELPRFDNVGRHFWLPSSLGFKAQARQPDRPIPPVAPSRTSITITSPVPALPDCRPGQMPHLEA
jgi:hypothetical protein